MPGAPERYVRVCHMGPTPAAIIRRPRPDGHQAFLLDPYERRVGLRQRAEGIAGLRFGSSITRPSGHGGVSQFSVLPWGTHVISKHMAAGTRALPVFPSVSR